ncbi:hypothetical protein NE236_26145 [Actinoallomurus purpureus]|uniref:hypothetical protein n=1 Tax=Actinoallomurus purpureus TaxID=478114 RepID=UPI0020937BB8|nr:hypothetical protein [Actinoallomurus purpureus]MCO6008463.1 hypothetical protein [Actinoallomurus purpureus]
MRRKLAIGMAAPSLTAVAADTYTRRTTAPAWAAFHQKLAINEIHVGYRSPVGHGDAR